MKNRKDELVANLEEVRGRISEAASRVGRSPDEITLIAVSKTMPVADILALWEVGQRDFGENYVQEWRDKVDELPDSIRWHYIGGLQSNKAKYLANRVALIHSIDSKSAVKELVKRSEVAPEILVQVNTGNDEAKGGIEPDAALEFVKQAMGLGATVRGFMTIPPFDRDAIPYFREMKGLFDSARKEMPELEILSMGMTSDFETAIELGATHIRVGTAIFGKRG